MSKEDVERYIRERKRNTRSVDEQVAIAHAMWEHEIGPNHEGLKADDIEDELGLDLDYKIRTSLSHLEEIDIEEETLPPGPETLVIAEWMDGGDGKIVLGEVEEAAREGLDALADEVEESAADPGETVAADGGGVTVRSVVASEFDLVPEKTASYLRATEKPVEVLNRAVEAIQDAEEVAVSDAYGKIAFINMPYRYRLTEKAVSLYEK